MKVRDFLATKQWARGLSTLARIYESKEFQDLTGLATQSDGSIVKSVSGHHVQGDGTAIVRGMHDENINTRTLNSVEQSALHAADERAPANSRGVARAFFAQHQRRQRRRPPGTVQTGRRAAGPGQKRPQRRGPRLVPAPLLGTSSGMEPDAGPSTTAPAPVSSRAKKPRNLDLSQIKAPDSYPEALKLLLGSYRR